MNPEAKTCKACNSTFIVEPDDFAFYVGKDVPPPTSCPECRQEERILFRNFKTFYKRPSDKSKTQIVSMYDADAPFPVWTHEEWWADDWDPKSYGRDFDFSRPFFEQLFELWKEVPHYALQNVSCVNCTYSNMAWGSKNCYLIFGCIEDEDCNYGHILWNSRDCADSLYLFKCELCYESIDCINCNKLFYSQDCENCSDSIGLFDCRDCTNCIGCVNLQHKSYHIFNKPVTREEYKKFLNDNPLSNRTSIEMILAEREKLRLSLPHRFYFGMRNSNVSGNHVSNSKNVHHSFDIKSGEDSKFGFTLRTFKGSYDVSFNPDIEDSYQTLACGMSKNLLSCHLANTCSYGYYSEHCYNSHNIFGCQGLKSSEYCILNKQYTKEEYEILKAKIIEHMKKTGEWGKWFPIEMCPFAYNESIVFEYSPKTKEEVLARGYKWKDTIPSTSRQGTMEFSSLPSSPSLYSSNLLKEVFTCEKCSKNYRLIQSEIDFYKKLGISIPQCCFNCRHNERMQKRLPRKLWHRTCMNKDCKNEFETSYAPERKEIVYCEDCYQKEVL